MIINTYFGIFFVIKRTVYENFQSHNLTTEGREIFKIQRHTQCGQAIILDGETELEYQLAMLNSETTPIRPVLHPVGRFGLPEPQ